MRFYIILPLFLFVFGCSQLPPELRNLKQVTITVTNNNTPIEGVTVSLVNKQPQTLRGCNGITNTSGVAKIATTIGSNSANGVAVGDYKIVLTQNVVLPDDLQPTGNEEDLPEKERKTLEQKRNAFIEKNTLVPEKLRSRTQSPIELTVDNKNAELTIDIAKY
jgi:hypothetical protein